MEFIDFRMPVDGFADPLMCWAACHQRAQRVALLLQRLFSHLNHRGPSDATRVTSAEVRRYLAEAAPRHHADEDVDLFPRLLCRFDQQGKDLPEAVPAVQAIERLGVDHRRLDDLWGRVRDALVHADHAPPTAEHASSVDEFVGGFIAHHAVEEEIITPAARQVLQPQDLAEIGEAMAARRGTTWAALSAPAARR
jgi:hypothetical protein